MEAGGEDAGGQGVARRVGRRLSNCDSVLPRNIFLVLKINGEVKDHDSLVYRPHLPSLLAGRLVGFCVSSLNFVNFRSIFLASKQNLTTFLAKN